MPLKPSTIELLSKHSLTRIAPIIEKYAQPCIQLIASDHQSDESLISKFGGNPDLPADFVWPEYELETRRWWKKTVHKKRADYLLQIRLDEVVREGPGVLLPPNGLLTFFFPIENQAPWPGSWQVYYSPDVSLLRPTQIPSDTTQVKPRRLTFQLADTIPDYTNDFGENLDEEAAPTSGEDDAIANFPADLFQGHPQHQMFGWSSPIQNDAQSDMVIELNKLATDGCSSAPAIRSQRDALLLLQVDSDDYFMWGDAGMVYFWIRANDLAQQEFRFVAVDSQCH